MVKHFRRKKRRAASINVAAVRGRDVGDAAGATWVALRWAKHRLGKREARRPRDHTGQGGKRRRMSIIGLGKREDLIGGEARRFREKVSRGRKEDVWSAGKRGTKESGNLNSCRDRGTSRQKALIPKKS